MYIHSYLGLCSAVEDQIHNAASLHVTYRTLSVPCLLMPWRLKSPGHQQAWYWPNKPEYNNVYYFLKVQFQYASTEQFSISSIRRVNLGYLFKYQIQHQHLLLSQSSIQYSSTRQFHSFMDQTHWDCISQISKSFHHHIDRIIARSVSKITNMTKKFFSFFGKTGRKLEEK